VIIFTSLQRRAPADSMKNCIRATKQKYWGLCAKNSARSQQRSEGLAQALKPCQKECEVPQPRFSIAPLVNRDW